MSGSASQVASMKSPFQRLVSGVMYLVPALLAACGGGSSHQFVDTPSVLIATIGNQPTSGAGTESVAITVRSGADVQLSGEDSYGGNISITNFSWKQTAGPSVTLLYRNASTISFTAPAVLQSTTLTLQLSVTNASGLTGTATAQVQVMPANDINRFLNLQATAPPPTVPLLPHTFRVGVSTLGGIAGPTADVPVCVQLARTVVYSPRQGAAESGALTLPTQQIDAKWSAGVIAAAGFATPLSFTNPLVSFRLPILNSEDVFAAYNTPGATVSNNELVDSDVDTAYVRMAVTATPGSCDGSQPGTALAGSQLMLQLYDEAGQAVGAPATAAAVGTAVTIGAPLTSTPLTPDGSANLTPEDFLRAQALTETGPPSPFETRESAGAYYAVLDPNAQKTTLAAWLQQNCFDPNDLNYGAGEKGFTVEHADYTNNFDLAFGRDMYFATCANGNMASVVVNYPSLGAAVNRIGAFLVVAMEYTPAAGSTAPCFTNPADPTTNTGACFTKFYAFAPDDRTGVFQRVQSANFDRRGQRYLPGACTACHGGTPGFTPGQPYPNSGNIDAAFMPWDVGSMLFADTDPAFPCNVSKQSPVCASINPSQYSQAAQLPHIQNLNALAWRTYQAPELESAVSGDSVDRYAAPRALITKWYGGDPAASTAHGFDDSVTPAGWLTSGETAGSAGDLYHSVFLHYCRACHTQINGGPQIENLQFQTLASFLYWDKPIVPGQPPFLQSLVYGQATMPQSRLSTDRFWVEFSGGTSAAQTLATYINAQPGVTPVPVDGSQNVIGPGAPQIVTLNGRAALVSTEVNPNASNTLAALPGYMLDAVSQSAFISTYQWSLCSGGPPASAGGPCPGSAFSLIGTPIIPAGSSAGAAELGAGLPAFATPAAGTYFLTVTAQGFATGATATATYPLVVP
jgi:hypothetical protein